MLINFTGSQVEEFVELMTYAEFKESEKFFASIESLDYQHDVACPNKCENAL